MSGTQKQGPILSDLITGDLVGLVSAAGHEFAHPGARADTSAAPGAATAHVTQHRCAIAAGASSIALTNRNITAQSTCIAVLSGAAADATLTSILRTTSANGSVTITGNANATAATQVDVLVFGPLTQI